jgi:hypothetical protein
LWSWLHKPLTCLRLRTRCVLGFCFLVSSGSRFAPP